MGQRIQHKMHRNPPFIPTSSPFPQPLANRHVTWKSKHRDLNSTQQKQTSAQNAMSVNGHVNRVNAHNNVVTKENVNHHAVSHTNDEVPLPRRHLYTNCNHHNQIHSDHINQTSYDRSAPLIADNFSANSHPEQPKYIHPNRKDSKLAHPPPPINATMPRMSIEPPPQNQNQTHIPPLYLLEDLSSVHHLLSLHCTTTVPSTLGAELSALETFCACTWGLNTAQRHLSYARDHFGQPELVDHRDVMMAEQAEPGVECVYRQKGLELFEQCVEAVRKVDDGLGRVLESCRGDWMVRFQACEGIGGS